MQRKLTKKDCATLDTIIKYVLDNGGRVNKKNLPPLEDEIFNKMFGVTSRGYDYYINILKDEDILDIKEGFDNVVLSEFPLRTHSFIAEGGFMDIFENQDLDKAIKRITLLEKRLSVLKLSVWVIIFFTSIICNLLYIFGVVSFSCKR